MFSDMLLGKGEYRDCIKSAGDNIGIPGGRVIQRLGDAVKQSTFDKCTCVVGSSLTQCHSQCTIYSCNRRILAGLEHCSHSDWSGGICNW